MVALCRSTFTSYIVLENVPTLLKITWSENTRLKFRSDHVYFAALKTLLDKCTFIKFNDSGYIARYEGRMLPGRRKPKLMSALWKPGECSVTRHTLDWSAESGPFMTGRPNQGLL